MKLIYPAIITKYENSYYITFPDLEGCQTFGDTILDLYENAKEALCGYCLSILEDGESLPKANTNIEIIEIPNSSFIAFIETLTNEKDKSIKKTLTIPYCLNDIAIDKNINFSKVLKMLLFKN